MPAVPKMDAAVLSSLRQPLLAQPRLVIDRIRASAPQGPFSIRGEAHFVGLNADDLATSSLASLLGKLEAQADLSVPAAWAGIAGTSAPAGRGASSTNPVAVDSSGEIFVEDDAAAAAEAGQASRTAAANAELDGLVRRGFLERKGELVTTHLELRQGKWLLNGHAFGD